VILPDVNVLVYAWRPDAPRHAEYHAWLEGVVNGPEAYAVCDTVLAGFLRIVTHPRVFRDPDTADSAMPMVQRLRERTNCVVLAAGPRHWGIFTELCRRANARGNLVPDAYLAALAIEHGCEWVTADRDYARFPGLRWRHPLE